MLFTVIFILLLIGAAVVGSIYSNFLVFYSNFEESQNYNKAYYEAISALERAELAIRQREPGFVGSGGRKKFNGEVYASGNSNSRSDVSVDGFSYISENLSTNLFWTINSLTDRIPATGMGNVDWMMATGDSVDYNMMDYTNSEIIMLYYDDSQGNPYNSGDVKIKQSELNKIEGVIRLPGQVRSKFGLLDTGGSLPGNMIALKNDAVVDWQIQGQTNGGDFTIFARQDVDQNQQIKNADSIIRESDLNNSNGVKLDFSENKRIPIWTKQSPNQNSGFMVVGKDAGNISNQNFEKIFSAYTGIQLKFSLLNELRTAQDEKDNYKTYPFLEYYLDFEEKSVPDKFYTINAEGKYGDFQINLLVKKPTIEQSVLGSFTVIF